MKVCPKCDTSHSNKGIFCSRSCANSRNFSPESIKKKIESNKKNPFIKNHKKIIKTLTYILNDFSKKYQKKYL